MKRIERQIGIVRAAMLVAALLTGSFVFAQNPTATGTINATLINKNGIALVFNSDAAGVALGGNGSAAASANFGTISAFGALGSGVTRTAVTAANFTVRTIFDVHVTQGGLTSASYTLRGNLAAAGPTGFTYLVDGVALTTAAQTLQTNGAYATDVPHNLDLQVLRAAPGAGGPAVGTPITATIDFTATAN
jgi:hypothetical protein